jgi:uncharacterized membrane protein YfcA
MAGTFMGARLGVWMPDVLQMSLLAGVMLLAAWRMCLVRQQPVALAGGSSCCSRPPCAFAPVAFHGLTVGVFTGMVGIGGGFLIVPALVLLAGLAIREAVSTSLVIVAMKSVAGFAGYLGQVEIDYGTMLAFALVAVVGSIAGSILSGRIASARLNFLFGVFLACMAAAILLQSGWSYAST